MEEVYFDEVEFYLKRIKRDRLSDRLTDLAIIHNPNAENPNKLVTSIKKQLQEIEGKSYLYKEKMTKQDEENLKEIARLVKANAKKRRGG